MQSLHLLKRAYDGGLLSAEEFDQWRRDLVRELVSTAAITGSGVSGGGGELVQIPSAAGPSPRISALETPPRPTATAGRPVVGFNHHNSLQHHPQQYMDQAAVAAATPVPTTPVSTRHHGLSTQATYEEIPLSDSDAEEHTPEKGRSACGGVLGCGGGQAAGAASPDMFDAVESGRLPSYHQDRAARGSSSAAPKGTMWGRLWRKSPVAARRKGKASSSSCGVLATGCVASVAMGTCLALLVLSMGLWVFGGVSQGAMAGLLGQVTPGFLVLGGGGAGAARVESESAWTHAEQDEMLARVLSHPSGAQVPTGSTPEEVLEREAKRTASRWAKGWGEGLHGKKLDDRKEQHCRLPTVKASVKLLTKVAAGMATLPECQHTKIAWADHDRLVFNHTLCNRGFPRYTADTGAAPTLLEGGADGSTGAALPAEVTHAYCHGHHNVVVRQMVDVGAFARAKDILAARQARQDPGSAAPMNVLVLVLDSVSRAQFFRALPRTVQHLNTLKGEDSRSRSFQFFKTMSNHVAHVDNEAELFSGSTSYEKDQSAGNRWIWDYYREMGYVTAWLRQPCQDVWSTEMIPSTDHVINLPGCSGGPAAWMDAYGDKPRCFGGRPAHQYTFDYLEQFYENYHGVGRMAIATLHEGQDESMTVLRSVDADLARFLKRIHKRQDNLLTMIVSPNGLHYGSFHETTTGEVEHHLPAAFLVAPAWYLKQHPGMEANLLANTNRLVTLGDLHGAMRHAVSYPRPPEVGAWVHSILSEVPPHRSCDDARLGPDVCACTPLSNSITALRHADLPDVETLPRDGLAKGDRVVGWHVGIDTTSPQPDGNGEGADAGARAEGGMDANGSNDESDGSDGEGELFQQNGPQAEPAPVGPGVEEQYKHDHAVAGTTTESEPVQMVDTDTDVGAVGEREGGEDDFFGDSSDEVSPDNAASPI